MSSCPHVLSDCRPRRRLSLTKRNPRLGHQSAPLAGAPFQPQALPLSKLLRPKTHRVPFVSSPPTSIPPLILLLHLPKYPEAGESLISVCPPILVHGPTISCLDAALDLFSLLLRILHSPRVIFGRERPDCTTPQLRLLLWLLLALRAELTLLL